MPNSSRALIIMQVLSVGCVDMTLRGALATNIVSMPVGYRRKMHPLQVLEAKGLRITRSRGYLDFNGIHSRRAGTGIGLPGNVRSVGSSIRTGLLQGSRSTGPEYPVCGAAVEGSDAWMRCQHDFAPIREGEDCRTESRRGRALHQHALLRALSRWTLAYSTFFEGRLKGSSRTSEAVNFSSSDIVIEDVTDIVAGA